MRLYGIVSPQFWTGQTGRKIRGDHEAQVLALYLMSCPNANMVGLYYLAKPLIAYETGLDAAAVDKGLSRLSEAGFCAYDEEREIVWVKEMARFQVGEQLTARDKRRRSIIQQVLFSRSSPLFAAFFERYRCAWDLVELDEHAPSATTARGSRDLGMPHAASAGHEVEPCMPHADSENEPCMPHAGTVHAPEKQEQEQEQGQDQEQEPGAGASPTEAGQAPRECEEKAARAGRHPGAEAGRGRTTELDAIFDAHDLGILTLAAVTGKTLRERTRTPDRRKAVAEVLRTAGFTCARLAARNLVLSEHHRDHGYLDIDYAMRRPEHYAELFDGPDEDLAEALKRSLHAAAMAPAKAGELPGRLGIPPVKDTRRKLVI